MPYGIILIGIESFLSQIHQQLKYEFTVRGDIGVKIGTVQSSAAIRNKGTSRLSEIATQANQVPKGRPFRFKSCLYSLQVIFLLQKGELIKHLFPE
jgi:hypothetical protein